MPEQVGKFALLTPPYSTLSYRLPESLAALFCPEAEAFGLRCAVPLGKGLRSAVFMGLENGAEAPGQPEQAAGQEQEAGQPEQGTAQEAAQEAGQEAEPQGPTHDADGPAAPKAEFQLKDLGWPLERHPLLSAAYMDFVAQLALRQAVTPGRILAGLLPAGLKATQARWRFFSGGKPKELSVRELAALPDEGKAVYAALLLQGRASFVKGRSKAENDLCILAADPPWAVKPSAKKQVELLDFLQEKGVVSRKYLTRALGDGAGTTLDTLAERGLVRLQSADALTEEILPQLAEKKKLAPEQLRPEQQRAETLRLLAAPRPYTFTEEQDAALAALTASLDSGKTESHLLYGLTGSGKTAVYLEFAAEVLRRGKSVLLLAPEVALALKLKGDVQARFPHFPVYLSHGYQPPAAREACFRELGEITRPASFAGSASSGDSSCSGGFSSSTSPGGSGDSGNSTSSGNPAGPVPSVSPASQGGRPVLVVGTRSALFLPVENIGAIILDEEHDSSFKQDEGLNYQAKDLAWYRAARRGATLVMGSATPDLKSFYAAQNGHIRLHRLNSRVGGGTLPEVTLVRLNRQLAGPELLAPETIEALKNTVERGEQAMILLNRRGYAPMMFCLACGGTVKCPHCDIALSYHKGRERLACHYCGYSVNFPSPCPHCKNMRFLPLGQGTEKLEEGLAAVLPHGARVLRLDRDSTSRPERMEEILGAFGRGEAEVLVGTQMLSKGHHFPRVTLAVVADGDLGLNLPDYRAAERTFQLLVQTAGRAGRGLNPGRVLIQTRDPAHYCWQYVLSCDYDGFYEQELARRQRSAYPPFTHLALVRLAYALDFANGPELLNRAGAALKESGKKLGLKVFGPIPAPLPVLNGQKRFHCMIKGQNWQRIRQAYAAACSAVSGPSGHSIKANGKFRLSLDIDPVNMM